MIEKLEYEDIARFIEAITEAKVAGFEFTGSDVSSPSYDGRFARRHGQGLDYIATGMSVDCHCASTGDFRSIRLCIAGGFPAGPVVERMEALGATFNDSPRELPQFIPVGF